MLPSMRACFLSVVSTEHKGQEGRSAWDRLIVSHHGQQRAKSVDLLLFFIPKCSLTVNRKTIAAILESSKLMLLMGPLCAL